MDSKPDDTFDYIVITPVKNEALYIEKTLNSITTQTVLPSIWVIVNDGSDDGTEDIIARWIAEFPWIRLVNLNDRGVRQRGKGVIRAFYAGFATLTEPFDYIVKLDGDVSFEKDYFEGLLSKFSANPKLGITGGGVYEQPDGKTWKLYTSKDHVRGATKIYRQSCFEEIGGLAESMGWDGIDEWKALSLDWEVQSFLEYRMYHYRFTGAATGFLKSCIEQGEAAYRMGYHPIFMVARGIRRMTDRPFIIGGLAMIAAYFRAGLRGDPILAEPEVVNFIRHTQIQKLLGLLAGKAVHE